MGSSSIALQQKFFDAFDRLCEIKEVKITKADRAEFGRVYPKIMETVRFRTRLQQDCNRAVKNALKAPEEQRFSIWKAELMEVANNLPDDENGRDIAKIIAHCLSSVEMGFTDASDLAKLIILGNLRPFEVLDLLPHPDKDVVESYERHMENWSSMLGFTVFSNPVGPSKPECHVLYYNMRELVESSLRMRFIFEGRDDLADEMVGA